MQYKLQVITKFRMGNLKQAVLIQIVLVFDSITWLISLEFSPLSLILY